MHVLADNPLIADSEDGAIRLVGGATASEGTVEVCRNRVWGGICDYRWDSADANVVCAQLGFQSSGECAQ